MNHVHISGNGTNGHIPAMPRLDTFATDAAAASRARQAADPESNVGGIAVDRLRSVIERVERLEEERSALAGDIKDIFSEAKSAGFDVATIKNIIRLRKKEPNEIEEQETLLDIYRHALGM
ncbi:hypothetical protein GCM10007207_19920 [Asaia siamensis]|uniref:GapR-like DNA-binding domain-containing protein n=2 Tax=Asaia siamensis TaxID=110479 RepID=A0ABQ1M4R7_9PROT|nr:hypothetical protein AA0323_1360 [Asaia siamensis NRIC 0323]GGC34391.1 hypothetical protein GCM10007207_19920 [Asaia siamensis]